MKIMPRSLTESLPAHIPLEPAASQMLIPSSIMRCADLTSLKTKTTQEESNSFPYWAITPHFFRSSRDHASHLKGPSIFNLERISSADDSSSGELEVNSSELEGDELDEAELEGAEIDGAELEGLLNLHPTNTKIASIPSDTPRYRLLEVMSLNFLQIE